MNLLSRRGSLRCLPANKVNRAGGCSPACFAPVDPDLEQGAEAGNHGQNSPFRDGHHGNRADRNKAGRRGRGHCERGQGRTRLRTRERCQLRTFGPTHRHPTDLLPGCSQPAWRRRDVRGARLRLRVHRAGAADKAAVARSRSLQLVGQVPAVARTASALVLSRGRFLALLLRALR